MKSWRTTTAGLTIIASTLTAVAGVAGAVPESWRPYCVLAGAIGVGLSAGIGLIVSRDNKVSTEEARGTCPKEHEH